LSLTLRDAQYLSWKTFKKLGKAEKYSEGSVSIADLMKKAEEISKRIQDSESTINKEGLGVLFSELLYVIFLLAEQHGVNLEESFLQTIDEIIMGSVG
jgi:hypothetical protein